MVKFRRFMNRQLHPSAVILLGAHLVAAFLRRSELIACNASCYISLYVYQESNRYIDYIANNVIG